MPEAVGDVLALCPTCQGLRYVTTFGPGLAVSGPDKCRACNGLGRMWVRTITQAVLNDVARKKQGAHSIYGGPPHIDFSSWRQVYGQHAGKTTGSRRICRVSLHVRQLVRLGGVNGGYVVQQRAAKEEDWESVLCKTGSRYRLFKVWEDALEAALALAKPPPEAGVRADLNRHALQLMYTSWSGAPDAYEAVYQFLQQGKIQAARRTLRKALARGPSVPVPGKDS